MLGPGGPVSRRPGSAYRLSRGRGAGRRQGDHKARREVCARLAASPGGPRPQLVSNHAMLLPRRLRPGGSNLHRGGFVVARILARERAKDGLPWLRGSIGLARRWGRRGARLIPLGAVGEADASIHP